ncbi:sialate:O-sulfotransferase 2-like [Glandiceps talaboti]
MIFRKFLRTIHYKAVFAGGLLFILILLLVRTDDSSSSHSLLAAPFLGEGKCAVRFAALHERALVALASFPGSGNMWIRHLIEKASGLYTGNCRPDKELFKEGFVGEIEHWRKGKTIAAKTHGYEEGHIAEFHSAILLVRNPYKALIAERSRKHAGLHSYPSENSFSGPEWEKHVAWNAIYWERIMSNWLQSSIPITVIYYEDIRQDPLVELEKMTDFLNVTLSDRVDCVKKDLEGRFHRPGDEDLGYDPFTPEMHADIDQRIGRVNAVLQSKGLKPVYTA